MNDTQDTNHTHKPRRHSKAFRTIVVVTALIAGVGGSIALANAKFGGPWHQGDRLAFMVERMTDRLDLSTEQQTKVESILTTSRTASEPYRAELTTLRSDMQALIEADEFYEDQVRIKLASKASAMVELMMIATRTMHDVRAELTPEQRVKADELLQRFAEKRGRHGIRQHAPADAS